MIDNPVFELVNEIVEMLPLGQENDNTAVAVAAAVAAAASAGGVLTNAVAADASADAAAASAVTSGNSATASAASAVTSGNSATAAAASAAAAAAIGIVHTLGLFFAATPTSSEVLALYTFVETVVYPDDFLGAAADIETNPTSSLVLTIQKNGSSVGTITVSTGGVFTFATTGTTVTFAVGDQIKIVGPATADATAANCSITLKGTRT